MKREDAQIKNRLKNLKNLKKVRNLRPIPSIRLLCVGAHKISDKQRCDRFYFWRWIMNLVSKNINVNFFYGTLVHKGMECFSLGYTPEKVKKEIYKEAKKQLRIYPESKVPIAEIELLRDMAWITIKVYNKLFPTKKHKLANLVIEMPFQTILQNSPLILHGTIDSYFKSKRIEMKELKTASRFGPEDLLRLKFDKQLNTYALGIKALEGKFPSKCDYTVCKKPSIRVRQKETVNEFLERYEEDLHLRPDFYFIHEEIRFGKTSMRGVFADIEGVAFDLYAKYGFFTEKQLLVPENWPKSERRCTEWGACQYLSLCRNPKNWHLYLRFYQMREIRYEIEKQELQTYKKNKENKL